MKGADDASVIDEVKEGGTTAEILSMKVGDRELRRVIRFGEGAKHDLADLVRVEFKAAG